MNSKPSSIFTLILGGGFLGTILILAALKNYHKDKVQLSDLGYFRGPISNYYIDYKQSPSVPGVKYKFLALEISGLGEVVGIYRPEQKYDDILNHIKTGDTAAIYYREHTTNYDRFVSGKSFNSDVYQLDIDNKNYVQIKEIKATHSKGNIAAIIGGIFIYVISGIGVISKIRNNG